MIDRFINRLIPGYRYRPNLSPTVDQSILLYQASGYMKMTPEEIQYHFIRYRELHLANDYARVLGESKTLTFEEAFLLYLAIVRIKPVEVVEIGTQYGKSTRRILDILSMLNLKTRLTCFDIVNQLTYASPQEVQFIQHDLTDDFFETVLSRIAPGLIFLDAHPYYLLKNIISAFLQWSVDRQSILAIHDCAPGLYNPHMRISKDEPKAVSSHTGHWERHVLMEIFGTENQLLDDLETPRHRLKIFNTTHGLALIAGNDTLTQAT